MGVVLIRWTDTHHGIELLEARDSGEKRLHYVTPDGGYYIPPQMLAQD